MRIMVNKMDFRETAFNSIAGEKTGTLCSSERKWGTKIKKLASKFPNEVKIKRENSDGSFVAEIPVSWFKISPKRFVSEETKNALRKRMLENPIDRK